MHFTQKTKSLNLSVRLLKGHVGKIVSQKRNSGVENQTDDIPKTASLLSPTSVVLLTKLVAFPSVVLLKQTTL